MEEILARLNEINTEVNEHFNNGNWFESINPLNEMIRLFYELKSIMKEHWPSQHQNSLATAYMNLGIAQSESRQLVPALVSYQSAIELQKSLRQDFDELKAKCPPEYQHTLVAAYINLGNAQSDSGQLAAAQASFQSAIELQKSLRQDFEEIKAKWPPEYQHTLVAAYMNLGNAQHGSGLLAAAQASYQSAIELQKSLRQDLEELKAKWPPENQNNLAAAYMMLGNTQYGSGQLAAAQASYQSAIKLRESLRQDFEKPKTKWQPGYKTNPTWIHIDPIQIQRGFELLAAAQASYQSTIELQESLRQDFEKLEAKWPPEYQNNLAAAYINLGNTPNGSGHMAAAQASYLSVIEFRNSLRQDFEEPKAKWPPEYQNDLAAAYMNLGNVQQASGQLAAAQVSYQSAIKLRESLRQDFEKLNAKWPPEYQNSLATAYMNLGNVQGDYGQLAAALTSYQSAIKLRESLRQDFEKLGAKWPPEYQNDLAAAYVNRANVQRGSEQLEASLVSYRSSIELQESLRQDFEQCGAKWPPQYQNILAGTYVNQGIAQMESGQLETAQASYQSSIELQKSLRQYFEERDAKWPPEYQNTLAGAYMHLGVAQKDSGRLTAAQASYQSAIKLQESLRQDLKELKAKWPPKYQNNLALAYMNIGTVQIASRQLAAALNSYQSAINGCEALRLEMDKHWLRTYQQTYFLIFRNYIRFTDSLPPDIPLHTILSIITSHLELYPTQSKEATSLLFVLLQSYLKKSQYNSAIQILSVLQGRELFNRLQKTQNESIVSPALHAYFRTQNAFKQAIQQYALIENKEAKATRESEIEQLRREFNHARLVLATDPAFKFMLTPFKFSISELQHNLNPDAARLMWLDLSDIDSSVSIQGVLAIPSSGTDVVWVDLTASDIKPALTLLTRLLAFQTPEARFYVSTSSMEGFDLTSYCQTHQQALGLSDDDIQVLTSLNEDNNKYAVDLSRDWVNKLLAKTWSQIMLMQTDIWQASELADWLAHHKIRKIYHLSHGQSHNKPLTLGSAPHLEHNVLPNLSLLRLRQPMADSSFTEHQYDGFTQIISCPGELDEQQLIPFTALEAEVVTLSLPEQSNTRVVSPTREITTLENQFPKHKNPLSFLHISCHGEQQVDGLTRLLLSTAGSSAEIKTHDLWQIAPENTIGFSMINACIGGIVLDNPEGNPQGLVVPLLARSRNVVSSLLPVNDIVATVFSALFYHFIQSNQTVEQAFYKTKQHIIDGDISEGVLERLMRVMKPIFQLEHLGQLISRLQHQLFEPTCDTYLLHCLAAIVPNIKEAEKISAKNGITLAEYLENEFRSRMKLTHVPPVMREIAMAGYQLYG